MRKFAAQFPALATVLALAHSAFAPAQELPLITSDQIITDPGCAFEDDRFYNYGCSVAVDETRAAAYESGLALVFIYRREGVGDPWTETQRISVESPNYLQRFPHALGVT